MEELVKNNFDTIITAGATIIVALIGFLGVRYQSKKKGSSGSGTTIYQESKGNNVTMIGIQNTSANEKTVTENGRKD